MRECVAARRLRTWWTPLAALGAGVALVLTGTTVATAATTDPNPNALELANAQLSRRAATQGMVLLENHDHALPLAKGGNVALFGVGTYQTVKGGTGSGNVNNRDTIDIRQGMQSAGYTVTTSTAYWNAMVGAYDAKYGSGTAVRIDYSSVEPPLTASSVQPTAPTDTAVFVVARRSGEGYDRSAGPGDYQLSSTEYDNIQLIGRTYKRVIVVLNVGGIVDTSFIDTVNAAGLDPDGGRRVDALLLMSQAGQESGSALADVLDGDVTPSGKLTDTWASKYSDYPASATFGANDGHTGTEQYTEGIYVGYRYFDSFYKSLGGADPAGVVRYPFGFGLSYTDFAIQTQSVTADMHSVMVTAKVTNVGVTYSGKDVVEVYASPPQTGLDKPYQQLAGYAKTDILAPGVAQVVTIRFDTTELASFNPAAASWVMNAGDYLVRVGDTSRNTRVAAKIHLGQDLTTERVAHELVDEQPSSQLTSDPANFYTYPTEQDEIAHATTSTLDASGFAAPSHASPYQQSVNVNSSSPYYPVDGNKISRVTAYVDPAQTNWERTGAPYRAKSGETLQSVHTSRTTKLYDVYRGTATMPQFVAGLSASQLSNIVEGGSGVSSTPPPVGGGGFTTGNYEGLGIPAMSMSDGPAGLRLVQKIKSTPVQYQWATAWPIGTLLAQTWDRDLITEVGKAIGAEMREYNVSIWLAPGMNIHRDPLNGRNFEYYSEDPLVAGLCAAATTTGVQSVPGAGVTIKHLAANNQEAGRISSDSVVGERALREIYLRGFQISIETAPPMAVMSSYNKLNGHYTSEQYDLLVNVLRGEWGFKGLVMSDWRGVRTGAMSAMYGGNDLIMAGNRAWEVMNQTVKTTPTIDVTGLPAYTKLVTPGGTSYSWSLGALTLSSTGTQTVATTVGAGSNLTRRPLSGTATRDVLFHQTFVANAPYRTVANAYAALTAMLKSSALSAGQKAAISVTNVRRQRPGQASSPVVSYTVKVKGRYQASYPMRLGDLQRSAMHILSIAMQSMQFQQLAAIQHVSGVTVRAYSSQFANLPDWMSASKQAAQPAVYSAGPSVTLKTTRAADSGDTYRGPVGVDVSDDDANARLFIDVGTGELRPYTGEVTVSGDGTHEVRALAVDSGGNYSPIATLTVRIDSSAP
jgi:beta-glucosidase